MKMSRSTVVPNTQGNYRQLFNCEHWWITCKYAFEWKFYENILGVLIYISLIYIICITCTTYINNIYKNKDQHNINCIYQTNDNHILCAILDIIYEW